MDMPNLFSYYLWKILRFLLDFITAFFFALLYGKKKAIPPITDDIFLQPAVKLAEKIRKKQVTSVEVIQKYASRVKELQPIINAVVDERFKEALMEANQVDELIASGRKSEKELEDETPLLGVPLSVKEHIGVKGKSFTLGLVSRRYRKAEDDAEVVKRLKNAGAIPFVSTNIPQLTMWRETGNKVYGTTNNPYDTRRNCGGSSGGEGALIAAAGSVIGIGTDIGGSIRFPSFCNGIYGHKPTQGVIPNTGSDSVYPDSVYKYSVIGPMCRYTADLKLMMRIMSNNDPQFCLNRPVDFHSLKIFYAEEIEDPFSTPVVPGIKKGLQKILQHFEKEYGVKAQKVNFKALRNSMKFWQAVMAEENSPAFVDVMSGSNKKTNLFWEFAKWCVRCSDNTLQTIVFALLDSLVDKKGTEKHKTILREFREFEREFKDMLGDNGVFFLPTEPEPAQFHQETIFKCRTLNYTTAFSVLRVPVTNIPIGLYKGLPIGVQCIGNRFSDRITIAVATELETVIGGWLSPVTVDKDKKHL